MKYYHNISMHSIVNDNHVFNVNEPCISISKYLNRIRIYEHYKRIENTYDSIFITDSLLWPELFGFQKLVYSVLGTKNTISTNQMWQRGECKIGRYWAL